MFTFSYRFQYDKFDNLLDKWKRYIVLKCPDFATLCTTCLKKNKLLFLIMRILVLNTKGSVQRAFLQGMLTFLIL